MSVFLVVTGDKKHGGTQPERCEIAFHFGCDEIGPVKLDAEGFITEDIGIVTDLLHHGASQLSVYQHRFKRSKPQPV
ncbi:hypothetical protein SDC9_194215 [bioreactor metagenome]|uniref:Uncharacterized protein n=1 Tax=bioreactor metagenome TaxID=1076179 RepID=A0A645IEA8_9ZZZZ